MMQSTEIQQRFNHIEQTIHRASRACQSANAVPTDLQDCIQQLDQRSEQARNIMQQPENESRIRQCVEDLERLGDRAKAACEQADQVDGNLKTAVMQVHQELSDLKHQLH